MKAKLTDLEKKPKSIEWISNVVVATKPGKIRICLDPQELNKVIQRPKYLIPTLEELLPIVSCPKTESSERKTRKMAFTKSVFTTPSAN